MSKADDIKPKKSFDLEKAQSIGIKAGSSKTYKMDVKTVWDKDKDRALVSSEVNDKGEQFVKTSDTALQQKLEGLGYQADKMVKVMHTPSPAAKQGAKAQSELEK